MPFLDECKREYQRQWFAKRRARGIELLGGVCAWCGSEEDLEVDHIDPVTKDPTIKKDGTRGFPWSRSWSWIIAELAKCEVLCRKCHRQKTNSELYVDQPEHGTRLMYRERQCRCRECLAWHAQDLRTWRAAQKKLHIPGSFNRQDDRL